MYEQHNRHCRKLLRARCHAEISARIYPAFRMESGNAVTVLEQNFAIIYNQDRRPGDIARG